MALPSKKTKQKAKANNNNKIKNKKAESTGSFAMVGSKTDTSKIYVWLTAFSTWKTGVG